MSCLIDNGRSRADACRDNSSGVFTWFIGNYPSDVVTPTDFLTFDTDGMVTALSGATTGVSFWEFVPERQSSDFTETYSTNLEFGSVSYEQKANIVIAGMNQSMQNQVKSLLAGSFLMIVKLKSGKFFLLGQEDSIAISGGSGQSGKKLGELNGYSLEFTAAEGQPSPEVDPAAMAGHINPNT
jgi:hypothetical protein